MSTLDDLVTICGDGPDLFVNANDPGAPVLVALPAGNFLGVRAYSDYLLGLELRARLASQPDLYVTDEFPISIAKGGHDRAGAFHAMLAPPGPIPNFYLLGGGCLVGLQEGADPRAYFEAMATLLPQAAAFVAAVSAVMPPGWLAASRRSVYYGAGASAAYPLDSFAGQALAGDGAFRFAAGSYKVGFTGTVYSDVQSVPPSISLCGSVFTGSGAPAKFDVSTTVTFSTSTVVTLSNASTVDQYAIGIVRVIPA